MSRKLFYSNAPDIASAVMPTSRTKIPSLVYGTAWKKDRTRDLVRQAILSGFRGVDTAAQPKHYQESLVGHGVDDALKEAKIKRSDVYIQTKFTSIHGQDPSNLPYDSRSSITEQVKTSVASSLRNLSSATSDNGGYLDCLVLHSPFPSLEETQEAWKAMESHVPHSVRTLGISNIYHLPALQQLYDFATVKPSVVQNRFYQDTGYDRAIRSFCEERNITYQSFWTLTANPHLLRSKPVALVVEKTKVSLPVALYALVLGLGRISILDGTTNAQRMREDLEGVQKVQTWASHEREEWTALLREYAALLEA